MSAQLKAVFAPDWRAGVPYQQLLADALATHDVRVTFLSIYKRIIPLTRLMRSRPCDVFHLHWPEAYFPSKGDLWDWFRRARFTLDLAGATRHRTLAMTAHNLYPHHRSGQPFVAFNSRFAYRRARIVFAHSGAAKSRLVAAFGLDPERICVVPHGDLSVSLGPPVSQAEARHSLGLKAGKIALMFGTVEPYKGHDEIIAWWKRSGEGTRLAIVGDPHSPGYRDHIAAEAAGCPNIIVRFGHLPDAELNLWLCAADVAVFNYRQIFTSGAGSLARSWGLPIVIPTRLDTLDLGEPSPFVHRYAGIDALGAALRDSTQVPPDFAAAAQWRADCSWENVAARTAAEYRTALGLPDADHAFHR